MDLLVIFSENHIFSGTRHASFTIVNANNTGIFPSTHCIAFLWIHDNTKNLLALKKKMYQGIFAQFTMHFFVCPFPLENHIVNYVCSDTTSLFNPPFQAIQQTVIFASFILIFAEVVLD